MWAISWVLELTGAGGYRCRYDCASFRGRIRQNLHHEEADSFLVLPDSGSVPGRRLVRRAAVQPARQLNRCDLERELRERARRAANERELLAYGLRPLVCPCWRRAA